jgi:predicted ATP-grasp superfamily ATP-dependent carboligase
MPGARKPTILVTNARQGSAVAIIRSLGRKGWRVVAADSCPRGHGFRSRHAADQVLYPPPEVAPDAFIATLLRAARDKQLDLIIPVTDTVILPLSQARARFDGLCQLALPEAAALEVTTNKLRTLALAERVAVPVPPTRLVRTVPEALAQGPLLGFPLVLKPQSSRVYRAQTGTESFKVTYAEGPAGLAEEMARFEGRCPVLLQEYCRGTGYGVELLMDRGRPLAAFQHKRLRESPPSGGASTFRESVPLDRVLYGHAVRLLEALHWTGLAMVEFKVGPGGPQLMEINGRVWGSLPLAVHSGMDFPGLLAELYLPGAPTARTEVNTAYAVGVRSRDLESDLIWIANVLRGRRLYPFLPWPRPREAMAALLGLLNPANKFDMLSVEDPGPGLSELLGILGKLGRQVLSAVTRAAAKARECVTAGSLPPTPTLPVATCKDYEKHTGFAR